MIEQTEHLRLRLRLWAPSDLEAGVRLWGDPEVMRWVGPPLSRAQVQASLDAGRRHHEAHGVQHFAVEERASGEVIGCCGLNAFGEPGVFELVFHLIPAAWGQGYASEAARAVIAWARQQPGIQKIVAGHHPENVGSARVLEKAGLAYVGLRQWEDAEQPEPFYELLL